MTILTFSCVAESEGPAATSTIILSPLYRRQTMLTLRLTWQQRRQAPDMHLQMDVTYVCQVGSDEYEENVIDKEDAQQ